MKKYQIGIVISPSTSMSAALSIYDIFDFINSSTTKYKILIDFITTETNEQTNNNVLLQGIVFHQVQKIYDFIFFPPLKNIDPSLLIPTIELSNWINNIHNKTNTVLCASCSNVYSFAYANILDNRSATTHWSLENDFKIKFKNIHLNIHKLIVDEGDILTSGGGYSYIDLCFYIINKFISHELAYHVAKYLVVDMSRVSQTYFKTLPIQIKHNDKDIEFLLDWIEKNIDRPITVSEMSDFLSISQKTLIRKFKNSTGLLPRVYLQQIKVEKAKYLLTNGNLTFSKITDLLGYSNPSSFRNLFMQYTNLTPSEYRKKFINLSQENKN